MKEGLMKYSILFCIPPREVFFYEKIFPDASGKAFIEMLQWDLEANVPFKENTYFWDFYPLDGSNMLLAAAEKIYIEELYKLFTQEKLHLLSVTIQCEEEIFPLITSAVLWKGQAFLIPEKFCDTDWTSGKKAALYNAAIFCTKKKTINFLPRSYQPMSAIARYIHMSIVGIVLFCLFMLYLSNCWEIHKLDCQLAERASQMAILHNEVQNRNNCIEMEGNIQHDALLLQQLSQHMLSWYSVLIHFGIMTIDNVWLGELRLEEENTLLIRGNAMDYDSLAKFIQLFEADKDFFCEGPNLENAARRQDGIIEFSAKLKLQPREN